MIRAILFDCFGVLVGRGFDETYRHAGGDPVQDHEFIEDILGQANLGLISEEEFREALTRRLNITPEAYTKAVKEAELPNDALLEYIRELKKTYKTGILSNVNSGVLVRKLSAQDLEECFDDIVTSAEVGLIKPQPEIYKLAAERLGVGCNECIFIDDREGYLKGARAVGMQTVLYKEFVQCRSELTRLLANSNN